MTNQVESANLLLNVKGMLLIPQNPSQAQCEAGAAAAGVSPGIAAQVYQAMTLNYAKASSPRPRSE